MIPEQVRQYPLIRVCRPDCRIDHHDEDNGNCPSPGKRPVRSTNADRPITRIKRWVQSGGNYGIVARSDNDLIILDSDSDLFLKLVRQNLPDTFTVRTGSGNYHFYYQSDYSEGNSTYKTDDNETEIGSIRVDNYQAVGPGSVHPDTGEKYSVHFDRPINPVPSAQIRDFIDTVNSEIHRKDGGGGGGTGGGGTSLRSTSKFQASDLDIEPAEGTLKVLKFVNSDSRRYQIAKTLDHSHPPRHVRVWACSFLYNVCGLTQSQLERLLNERAVWATDSDRVQTEIRSLVHTSIPRTGPSQANESVNLDRYLGPAYKSDDERRKTESGTSNPRYKGGVLEMVDDTVNKHATVKKDSLVCRSGEVRVVTEDSSWQYHGVLFGEIEEEDDELGTVVNWEYNQYGNKKYNDLGDRSPEELRLAAEALEELADELEE